MRYIAKNATVTCSKQENKLPVVEVIDNISTTVVAKFIVDFDTDLKLIVDKAKAFADSYVASSPEPAFDEDAAKKLEQVLIDLLG